MKSNSEVERLVALGYAREDIQVLPDGSVTIVPADEMKSSAITVARATAPARLERMLARKQKMDEDFKLSTAVPLPMSAEQFQEYLNLLSDIDKTVTLIGKH